MITIITGSPGHGKSLYALGYVEKLRTDVKPGESPREVYYAGIEDLKLPWVQLENPLRWYDAPSGAIIVLDESQNYFRPRAYGKDVPESVSRFEVHRHQGHDVVLITQNPMLIDVNIRRLAGKHLHLVRAFGAARAVVHEWGTVQSDPNLPAAKADALDSHFAYPAESYQLYKSAELHTVKRKVPWRIWLLLGSPFILVALGVAVYLSYVRTAETAKVSKQLEISRGQDAAAKIATGLQVPGGAAPGRPVPGAAPVAKTLAEIVKERTPLIAGLPQTAPIYYAMTKPVAVPVPAACVSMRSKGCRCYTQQATLIPDVDIALCAQIVARGYFQDFDPHGTPGVDVRSSAEAKPAEKPAQPAHSVALDRGVVQPVVVPGPVAAIEEGYAGAGGSTRGPLLPPSALRRF